VREAAGSAAVDKKDAIAVAHVAADACWGGGPDVSEVLVHLIFPFGWVWGPMAQNCDTQNCVIGPTCVFGWWVATRVWAESRMECVKGNPAGVKRRFGGSS
jgi:hypothetical protein